MSRILVIDDERSIRNTLKDILEYEKYEVDLAEDGQKARSFFARFRKQLESDLDQAEILIVERDVRTLGELENQPGLG